MYPRNAATPPRIAVGSVVQISDGAVQTSGVSIEVTPEGGSASAGGGTVSYVQGVVHYVPTQAETNYTAFTVVAYKASCLPASVSVVTTEESTAGRVRVGTNGDKTGYSISGTKTTLDALNDIAATAIVSGGAITTSGGAVSNVTTVATTTTNSDMRGTDNALLASATPSNWSLMAINGSGQITTSNPASGGGSAHTAADVAALILETPANKLVTNGTGQVEASNMRGTDSAYTGTPPTVSQIRAEIDSNSTVLNNITNTVESILTDTGTTLPAVLQTLDNDVDAVGQIVVSIQTVTSKLDTTLESDGASGQQFTTLALENGPSGSGGGGGDATAANQTTILSTLAAMQGDGFDGATDSLEAIRDNMAGSDASAIAASIIQQLTSLIVILQSPYDEKSNTLKLVATADYKTGTPVGPLQMKLSGTNMTAGDAVKLGAELKLDDGTTQRIDLTGSIVDVSGTLYGQFEIEGSTDLNVTPSLDWRWGFAHVDGSGNESHLKADQVMHVLENRVA